jgi:hypothetical protein
MNIFLGMAVSGAIVLSVVGLTTSFERVDHKPEQRDAGAVVDQYRLFMFVADQFMKAAPAVAVNTVRTWEEMKVTPFAPTGARAGGMPTGWKVIQTPATGWVACTEMNERSISMISQLAPRPSVTSGTGTITMPGLVPVSLGTDPAPSHIVIGTPTAAPSLAALCQ